MSLLSLRLLGNLSRSKKTFLLIKMDEVYAFIEQFATEMRIDESHGLSHSKSAVHWATLLMDSFPDISVDERTLILYSIALHDMCDSKYTNVEYASKRLYLWLIHHGLTHHLASASIGIMTTMSYSKLKKEMVNNKPKYPDHGPWTRAYHIVRHADLLDAYQVKRSFLYNKHIYPDLPDEDTWNSVKVLFQKRIFQYVSDGWIFYPKAIELATELEQTARDCIEQKRLV
jgi:hypothetical protein